MSDDPRLLTDGEFERHLRLVAVKGGGPSINVIRAHDAARAEREAADTALLRDVLALPVATACCPCCHALAALRARIGGG